jgi:fumarate reductase subunit C
LWFLKKPAYTKFMVREITGAFIAAYALFLLCVLCAAHDSARFHQIYAGLKTPLSITLHLVVLWFALFHSVTFFDLTPRALPVRIGDKRVPDEVIAWSHYFLWVIVSLGVALVVWRGW